MFFKEILGQEQIKKNLLLACENNKIAHAQMFVGEPNLGGLPLAIAFARYLLCSNKGDADSCGKCSNCIYVNKSNHPDIHFLFPTIKTDKKTNNLREEWNSFLNKNAFGDLFDWISSINAGNKQLKIGVEDSANLIKKMSLKSFLGGEKIAIVWMPEKMSLLASNKMLKTIEEPPKKTKIILVSMEANKLLKTITSRTQIIELEKGMQEELINNNDFLDQFINWMRLCFKPNMINLQKWIDAFSSIGRENQKMFLKFSLNVVRDALMLTYNLPSLKKQEISATNFNLEKFAPFINGNNAVDIYEKINEAHYCIGRNANPKILMMDLSFKLNKLLNTKM